jgi:hypothetical protein
MYVSAPAELVLPTGTATGDDLGCSGIIEEALILRDDV